MGMATAFEGVDFYDLDRLLSEEERAVRDTVRSWVDTALMPIIGDAYVHPELTGRGVGRLVLDLLELRARELEADWPDGERIVLQCAHLVGDDRAPRLLASRGFDFVRSGFRMVADVSGDAPAAEWPEGIELRPLDTERDGPLVHAAIDHLEEVLEMVGAGLFLAALSEELVEPVAVAAPTGEPRAT